MFGNQRFSMNGIVLAESVKISSFVRPVFEVRIIAHFLNFLDSLRLISMVFAN